MLRLARCPARKNAFSRPSETAWKYGEPIAECAAVDRSLIGDEVLGDTKAESDRFGSPDGIFTFEQSVGFAADEDTAVAAITAIGSDALPDCYEQALTESFASTPGASVSGLYFGHPAARYFSIGRVGRDQVEDYAARKGEPLDVVERWLRPNLAYDPR